MRKIDWRFVALFVIAYAGFLGYFWIADRRDNTRALSAESDARVGVERALTQVQDAQHSHSNPRMISAVDSHDGAKDRARSGVEQSSLATPLTHSGGQASETLKYVNTLSTQASDAASEGERAKAIAKLRNTVKTDESVRALADVLRSDTSLRNRLFAVTALRSLARQGDDDGAIKTALGQAVSDSDPKVASAARGAYEQLESRGSSF